MEYYIHILIVLEMNLMLVVSLNLINGYLGEFALGHAGFMGVGAYVAAVISTMMPGPWFVTYLMSLLAAVVAASFISWLIGLVSFRTAGDYLAIITLGFNMIIVNVIQNIDFVGGPRGFTGIPKNTGFLSVTACTVFTFFVLYNLIHSNYGRIWSSIRDNVIAAELMGVNVNKMKNVAFTVAAGFAGLTGALWAQYQQFITPRSFDYVRTTEILVMLYLGGVGSLSGSILGVVLYTLIMELLRNFLSFDPRLAEMRMIISPLILIVVMLTRQNGLMGFREWRWLRPKENFK
jgi:branched-chain amino acid transport system permease protein